MLHSPANTTHDPLPVQDRGGQSSCYNCVIETYETQAFNLASRMLNDRVLAEDTMQEALVSGYRSFSQFRGGNLGSWVMRIVANQCRDMLRSRRARPTTPLDPIPSGSDDSNSIPSALDLLSTEEDTKGAMAVPPPLRWPWV